MSIARQACVPFRGAWLWPLLLVTATGGALRLTAVHFGLPDRLRPDEQYLVETAARLGGRQGFDPHFAEYPAAQIYFISGLGHTAQELTGDRWRIDTPQGRESWYLTGRLASATMGTLTIPLTALLAAEAVPSRAAAGPAGLLAAALTAGAFLHVRDSHFATTDVPMTFWQMAAWLAMAAVLRTGRLRASLAAGALVGLAAATKYPAITLALPLTVASLWHRGAAPALAGTAWPRLLHLAAALAALGLAFFLASPYVVLDPETTRAAFVHKVGHLTASDPLAAGSLTWLLGSAMPAALGWPLVVLAIASLVLALLPVGGGTAALLAAPDNPLPRLLALWLVVASVPLIWAHRVFIRYAVPLIPVAMALISVAALRLATWRPRIGWAAALIALAALGPSIGRAIAFDRLLLRADTRTIARHWMESNLPPGTIVYSPAFGAERMPFALPEPVRGSFVYAPASAGVPDGAYVLIAEHPLPHAHPPSRHLAATLESHGTLLFEVDPFRRTPLKRRYGQYEKWDAFFLPLSDFSTVERPGPRLRLYRVSPAAAAGG